MHFFKLFVNSIHKEPPFRNPYVYLKEEEFIKLQKQKQLSESKLLKEKKEAENLKHNQIISALDNLSNAVTTKKLVDTRKKLTKKKENLIDIIFPIESNISNGSSHKDVHSNEKSKRNIKENKRLFRFFTSHISKSTINSCLTSLCTKDYSDSEYTDISTTSLSPEVMNNEAIDTTNTSICSSVVALKSKSFVPSADAANLGNPVSQDYSTASYRISFKEYDNDSIPADDLYPSVASSSFYSLKTLSLPTFPKALSKILEPSINYNTYDNNNPFIKTVLISDSTFNFSKRTNSAESRSTVNLALDSNEVQRPQNYSYPTSRVSYITSQMERQFYNVDGSIVLPKANYTDRQLNSFRKRYHNHYFMLNRLRHNSCCSIEQNIEPKELNYTTNEQSTNERDIEICTRSFNNRETKNNVVYLSRLNCNYIQRQNEEFECSSVYDSESEKYYGNDYLIL